MEDDERCCGTGMCIIDAEGRCWCGQQWDGEKMCHPSNNNSPPTAAKPQTADEADDAGDPADGP